LHKNTFFVQKHVIFVQSTVAVVVVLNRKSQNQATLPAGRQEYLYQK